MGLEMKYFVLNPRSKRWRDPFAAASRRAMRAYADLIKNTDAELADALNEWANKETAHDIELMPSGENAGQKNGDNQ